MVGPKYTAPTAPAPPAFKEIAAEVKEGDGWKRATPGDDLPRGRWWEIYGDAQLNALEEQVSVSNQNLKAAEARYQQLLKQYPEYRDDHGAQTRPKHLFE